MKRNLKNVSGLQEEYHTLCGKLIELDYTIGDDVPLAEFAEKFEEIENRLKEIEQELLFFGIAIDKHHMLHLLGD